MPKLAVGTNLVPICTKIKPSTRAQLEDACRTSSKHLSVEIRSRIEASFEAEAITARLDRIERMLSLLARPDNQWTFPGFPLPVTCSSLTDRPGDVPHYQV